ncbi:Maf family nucleotide pyrophosphatase [Undibacterium sp. Di24W]|uniref:Maf family nucleotide pyrophosphatase n=1 Tax=Undibacterium sp. Di24W TaxID=3413033 RepID=UPI003BEFF04D
MSQTSSLQQIILASSSAYRKDLLQRLRLPFLAIAPDLDESPLSHEAPEQTALRLAQKKAEAIAKLHPEAIIIGSDQVATLDGLQIGKPGDHERALKQLQMMRGREVIFHTALCVLHKHAEDTSNILQIQNCQTLVRFRDLGDAELDAYLRIEQPYDCAGSAKNEGLGIIILDAIHSDDPTALTGLPLITLTSMLRNLGVSFFR